MIPYKNLGGDSGVVAYECSKESEFIIVRFKGGAYTDYTYTYVSCGALHVEQMKLYAIRGEGLNSYISINKPKFASKK